MNNAQLHCLSGDGDLPCFLLELTGLKILIDFPLPLDHLSKFIPISLAPSPYFEDLPEKNWFTKEVNGVELFDAHPQFTDLDCGLFDLGSVDFILISNAHSFMALPFLLKRYPDLVSCRRILCTEPTIQLGRLLCEEIISITECLDPAGYINKWQEAFELKNPLIKWYHFYERKDLNRVVDQTRTVSFGEIIQLNEYMDVMVLSSGYSIGSCNWLFQCGKIPSQYKLAYIGRSSTLSTHPRPLYFDNLTECDAVILTQLTRHPPVDPNYVISGFCDTILQLIEDSHNILVPCHGTGIIYDLFECLSVHLSNAGIKDVTILFVSPISDQSLAFSNIFCEFLSNIKAERTLIPDYPFGHTEMIRLNQLKAFKYIYSEESYDSNTSFGKSFKNSKQIIFAGHPSLRMGEAVHFMELFKDSPTNAVIFIEPDYCKEEYMQQALAPFRPMQMKSFVYPLDTSLNFEQASFLLKHKIKPGVVITSNRYTKGGISSESLSSRTQLYPYSMYESVNIPISVLLCPRYPLVLEISESISNYAQLIHFAGTFPCMICRFAAVCSTKIPGRHQPSIEYGGILPFIAEMPSNEISQYFLRRQYACAINPELSIDDIGDAMLQASITVSKECGPNILELFSSDKLWFDVSTHTVNVECNDIMRRKRIKEAIQTLYKPLFVEL